MAISQSENLFQRQLASVHLLLSSERVVAEHDILLATVFDALATGDKTTAELREHVQTVWAGIAIPLATLEAALEAARVGGFIERTQQLGERSAWLLTHGRSEVADSEGWAEDVVERCRRQLREEAHAVLGPVRDSDLAMWLDLLLRTLSDGVKHSFEVLQSNVSVVASSLLIPDAFDLDRMLELVERGTRDVTVRAFLQGMVLNAIDQSHSFGVEVVHNLCVGYVLLSYMKRKESQAAVATTGSVIGELALLDTPALLRMLGPANRSQPVLEVIAMAIDVGFVVAIQPETLGELEHLLGSRERQEVRMLEAKIADGTDPQALRDLVSDDVLGPWLDAYVQGQHKSWREFRDSAAAVVNNLRAMGCKVLEPIARDGTLLPPFATALADVLEEKQRRARREEVLLHDAALLERVLAARRANPPSAEKIWPGGVVVTTDRSLQEAYERVVSDRSAVPVAITLSQFMGIVTGCSNAAAAEKVALVASEQMGHDTMFALTSRFPLDIVLSLAENVTSSDPISRAEARMLQLDLAMEVRQRPGLLEIGTEEHLRLVSDVLDRRNRRVAAALRAQRKFAEEDRVRSATAAAVAAARADEAERQREHLTERLVEAVGHSNDLRAAVADSGSRSRRLATAAALTTVLVMLTAMSAFAGHGVAAFGFGLSALASAYVGHEWADSRRPFWMYLAALVLSAIGIIDLVK